MSVKFIAEGKVSNDPKTFSTQNSVGLKLNIYCSRKNKQTEKWEHSYYSFVFWGEWAKTVAITARKGQKVKVEGAINAKQVDVPGQTWKDTKYDMVGFGFEIIEEPRLENENRSFREGNQDKNIQGLADKFEIEQKTETKIENNQFDFGSDTIPF